MFSKVLARFWVQKTTKTAASKGATTVTVELAPVIRGAGQPGYDPEANVQWSKFTPSGRIEMTITNEDAAAIFEANMGRDVAITFEFIDPPTAE